MGLIYCAALENSLIMCFMDSRLWNTPLTVFFRLVDAGKIKLLVASNRRIATALIVMGFYLIIEHDLTLTIYKLNSSGVMDLQAYVLLT